MGRPFLDQKNLFDNKKTVQGGIRCRECGCFLQRKKKNLKNLNLNAPLELSYEQVEKIVALAATSHGVNIEKSFFPTHRDFPTFNLEEGNDTSFHMLRETYNLTELPLYIPFSRTSLEHFYSILELQYPYFYRQYIYLPPENNDDESPTNTPPQVSLESERFYAFLYFMHHSSPRERVKLKWRTSITGGQNVVVDMTRSDVVYDAPSPH